MEQVFGNRETFAIRYRSYDDMDVPYETQNFAYCHLIIQNNLIGDKEEICYLKTWVSCLSCKYDFIKENRLNLFPKEFWSLSNREIFESVQKANQLEEEYKKDFLYLPLLDRSFWYNHHFTLDETIDGFLIYYYIKDNTIVFLIDRLNRETDSWSNNFIFASVPVDDFLKTVEETLASLVTNYPFLKDCT